MLVACTTPSSGQCTADPARLRVRDARLSISPYAHCSPVGLDAFEYPIMRPAGYGQVLEVEFTASDGKIEHANRCVRRVRFDDRSEDVPCLKLAANPGCRRNRFESTGTANARCRQPGMDVAQMLQQTPCSLFRYAQVFVVRLEGALPGRHAHADAEPGACQGINQFQIVLSQGGRLVIPGRDGPEHADGIRRMHHQVGRGDCGLVHRRRADEHIVVVRVAMNHGAAHISLLSVRGCESLLDPLHVIAHQFAPALVRYRLDMPGDGFRCARYIPVELATRRLRVEICKRLIQAAEQAPEVGAEPIIHWIRTSQRRALHPPDHPYDMAGSFTELHAADVAGFSARRVSGRRRDRPWNGQARPGRQAEGVDLARQKRGIGVRVHHLQHETGHAVDIDPEVRVPVAGQGMCAPADAEYARSHIRRLVRFETRPPWNTFIDGGSLRVVAHAILRKIGRDRRGRGRAGAARRR